MFSKYTTIKLYLLSKEYILDKKYFYLQHNKEKNSTWCWNCPRYHEGCEIYTDFVKKYNELYSIQNRVLNIRFIEFDSYWDFWFDVGLQLCCLFVLSVLSFCLVNKIAHSLKLKKKKKKIMLLPNGLKKNLKS